MDKNSTKTNGKAPQNGSAATEKPAPKPEPSQTLVKENGQFNEKALQPEEEKQPVVKPEISVEDKIRKINSLQSHIDTRNQLKSHLVEIENLRFGDYDEKDTITLAKNGKPYVIRNTQLCKKVQTLLRTEFSAKIVEVEAQIDF